MYQDAAQLFKELGKFKDAAEALER